jgi:hypothetical protein
VGGSAILSLYLVPSLFMALVGRRQRAQTGALPTGRIPGTPLPEAR